MNAYTASKIAHMMRMGIPAGVGPNGGAMPDWAKIAEQHKADNPPKEQPRKREPRDIVSGHFGAAAQNALRQVAAADHSDPFAVARLRTHLTNGVEDDPAKVSVRAETTIRNRHIAIEESYAKWRASQAAA